MIKNFEKLIYADMKTNKGKIQEIFPFRYLPFSIIFGVVLKLDHRSVLRWMVSMVWLFVIIELSELISDLLYE